ncbi:MAG: hypothetical protein ACE5KJ_03500 [Candidatus Zixiibacteriota bacterium]
MDRKYIEGKKRVDSISLSLLIAASILMLGVVAFEGRNIILASLFGVLAILCVMIGGGMHTLYDIWWMGD